MNTGSEADILLGGGGGEIRSGLASWLDAPNRYFMQMSHGLAFVGARALVRPIVNKEKMNVVFFCSVCVCVCVSLCACVSDSLRPLLTTTTPPPPDGTWNVGIRVPKVCRPLFQPSFAYLASLSFHF